MTKRWYIHREDCNDWYIDTYLPTIRIGRWRSHDMDHYHFGLFTLVHIKDYAA